MTIHTDALLNDIGRDTSQNGNGSESLLSSTSDSSKDGRQSNEEKQVASLSDNDKQGKSNHDSYGENAVTIHETTSIMIDRNRSNTEISDVTAGDFGAHENVYVREPPLKHHVRKQSNQGLLTPLDVSQRPGINLVDEANKFPFHVPSKNLLLRSSSSPSSDDEGTNKEVQKINSAQIPKFFDSDGDNDSVCKAPPKQYSQQQTSEDPTPPPMLSLEPDANIYRHRTSTEETESTFCSTLPKTAFVDDSKMQNQKILPYHERRKLLKQNTMPSLPRPKQSQGGYQRKYMKTKSSVPPPHSSPVDSEQRKKNPRPYGQAPSPIKSSRHGLPPSGNRSRNNSADNGSGNRTRSNSADKPKGSRLGAIQTSIKQRPQHQVDLLGRPQPRLRPADNRVRKGSFDANGPLLRRVRSSSIDSGCESEESNFSKGSFGKEVLGLGTALIDDVKEFFRGDSKSGKGEIHKKANYGSISNEKHDFHNRNQQFLQLLQNEQNGYKQGNGGVWGDLQANKTQKPMRKSSPTRTSSPRPPNSRGNHRPGLPSIENDDWIDYDATEKMIRSGRSQKKKSNLIQLRREELDDSSSTNLSSLESDASSDDSSDVQPRISNSRISNESLFRDESMGSRLQSFGLDDMDYSMSVKSKRSKKSRKKKSKLIMNEETVRFLYKQWEKERIEREESKKLHNRFKRWVKAQKFKERGSEFFSILEVFISNLPLTCAGVAVSFSSLANVLFKFMEENNPTCVQVAYRSEKCTFPEFPGCFNCNIHDPFYKLALQCHYICQFICLAFGILFLAKVILARRVLLDELNNPITMSPLGLYCIAMAVIAVGKGILGYLTVVIFSILHVLIYFWFVYSVLAYNLRPDPSWFPNTCGIGMTAIKLWVYHPWGGFFLLSLSLVACFAFFPAALYRVFVNRKISATVAWMIVSGPSSSFYASTILGQPTLYQESHMDVSEWKEVHLEFYVPFVTVLFAMALVGMATSVMSLVVRYREFRSKPFSPAHVAFCFATLNHANACQAYLATLDSYLSDSWRESVFRVVYYYYWCSVLMIGSSVTLVITVKFLSHLPEWTLINVDDEIEPPAPNATLVSEIIETGDNMRQAFVSPAILQANETGALVRLPGSRFVRTRKLTAFGFEPIMRAMELEQERELLLEHVANNPAKRRHRTLSVPGIDIGINFGSGEGVWGFDNPYNYNQTPNANRERRNTDLV